MSAPPTWDDLDAALDQALQVEGDDRAAYLSGLPAVLRDALGPLLASALADDAVLDHPGTAFAALAGGAAGPIVEGARVGPYRIDALIGEGGMGRVYRARRADGAYDQTVAVKVVRQSLALAGTNVSARLRRERDLLAALDHSNIARLVDGGETEDGVPYLVTEYIDGVPITEWADANGLDARARARLVAEVARAVDHAHRRLVVHRDLKPSNILVAMQDGSARPVVLDFGIAKLLKAPDDSSVAFPLTRTGIRMLTPAYAAPELYDPTSTVTTAADVYGLGAVLYELLTGHRPHDDAPQTGPPTTEPTRPSQMVMQGHGGPAPGEPVPSRTLRGDLDTICLKALHPDPARRYATAADLADDLARYLDGRPVEARPDSLWYVAGRFARRNRTAVGAGLVAALALVVGLGTSLLALENERDARAEAEVSARRATEAADLLAGMFQTADPDYDDGRVMTVAEAVREGVGRVRQLESDPLRAYLLLVLGETYIQLGEPWPADSLLQEALAIHGEDAVGEEPTRVRKRLMSTRDAMSDPERVIDLAEAVVRDHPDDAESVSLALWWTSRAHADLGRTEASLAAARRAMQALDDHSDLDSRIRVRSQLGEALVAADRLDEAIPHFEEAVSMSEAAYGRNHRRTSRSRTSLGRALGLRGDIARAEEELREVIRFHGERYGEDRNGYPYAYLGEARLAAGRFDAAAAALDSAVTMVAPFLPADHLDVGLWLTHLATAQNGAGRSEEALGTARRALAVARAQPERVRPQMEAAAREQIAIAQGHR